MGSIPIYFGDAFTTNGNSPFTGNPGAICILEYDDDISDETKQKIANEVNLSAVAFISLDWSRAKISQLDLDESLDDGQGSPILRDHSTEDKIKTPVLIQRKIRWFTPTREIPLCGHDTLIPGKLLAQLHLEQNPSKKTSKEIGIEFDSPARGVLGATYNYDTGRITLNFPLSPCLPIHTKDSNWLGRLVEATLSPKLTLEAIQDIQYSPSSNILLVRLVDSVISADLRGLTPNFGKLKLIQIFPGMIGVILTVKGTVTPTPEEVGNGIEKSSKPVPHFYTRYFAPWAGVNEDPACGSAHTVLTPYWFHEYGKGFGETLLGQHLSPRGGLIYCTMVDNERVALGGEANILIRGELML